MASVEFVTQPGETEAVTAHVLWITVGLSCEGDSVAMTSATNPSLEDIITGRDPRDAEGGRPQPGARLRGRRRSTSRPGSTPRRASSTRSCWSSRARSATRRSTATATGRASASTPPTASRSPSTSGSTGCAQGRGGRRGRDVRDLRRHPGDEEQPDRRDGRPRLPGLELEVQGRHPDRQHPGLPGPARQHDRDARAPRLRAGRHGAGARARRRGPPGVAVRPHRARELQPRRASTRRATSPPSTAPTTAAW